MEEKNFFRGVGIKFVNIILLSKKYCSFINLYYNLYLESNKLRKNLSMKTRQLTHDLFSLIIIT